MPEQLLSLLGTNLVDFLVYGAIALVVLVGVCKCIYPVFRNGSLLNRAVAKLEKTAGNNQRPPWREPRFLGRALRGEKTFFLHLISCFYTIPLSSASSRPFSISSRSMIATPRLSARFISAGASRRGVDMVTMAARAIQPPKRSQRT